MVEKLDKLMVNLRKIAEMPSAKPVLNQIEVLVQTVLVESNRDAPLFSYNVAVPVSEQFDAVNKVLCEKANELEVTVNEQFQLQKLNDKRSSSNITAAIQAGIENTKRLGLDCNELIAAGIALIITDETLSTTLQAKRIRDEFGGAYGNRDIIGYEFSGQGGRAFGAILDVLTQLEIINPWISVEPGLRQAFTIRTRKAASFIKQYLTHTCNFQADANDIMSRVASLVKQIEEVK